MHRKILIACLALLALTTIVIAQTRLRSRGAQINITSAGAISLTPFSGQGIVLNGGTPITKVLSATASLNFGATAAGTCDTLTITVTGAADGDSVSLGIPHALANSSAYQSFNGWVSAANTVSVRRCNLTNATTALADPAAATVRATIIQF